MDVGQTIRETQNGWISERIEKSNRAQVYAVAIAARLGREDLTAVRLAAALEDDSDLVVRLARDFDEATYPLPARLTPEEALTDLAARDYPAEMVKALRAVQPLIQPVGL